MVKWTCELHLTGGLRGRQLRLNPLTTLQRSTDLILQVRKEQFRGLKPPTLEGPQDSVVTVDLVVRQPRFGLSLNIDWASMVAQSVKDLPAMQETQVQFLGGKDPLEKEMVTHSSILAWKIP